MKKNYDIGLLILRVSLGALMLFHGAGKLQSGVSMIGDMLTDKGLPAFIAYGVIIGEVIAPILMIIGFRTRIAAFIFAFNMVVAVAMAHAGDVFKLTEHGSWALELQGLYFFGGLALFFTGGGKFGVSSKNNWD